VSTNEIVEALDVIERFYEQARSQLTEWENRRWQEKALEHGWPMLDLDTGRVYGNLDRDDAWDETDDTEDPLDGDPADDFDGRLRDTCALMEGVVYGSSENARGDAEKARVELIEIKGRWPPEERNYVDDAIQALSNLCSATAGEDRFFRRRWSPFPRFSLI
jgi:hypothetical protein